MIQSRLKSTKEKSLTIKTRQSKKGIEKKQYNPYGEDFFVDKIALDEIADSLMGLNKIMVSQGINFFDHTEMD